MSANQFWVYNTGRPRLMRIYLVGMRAIFMFLGPASDAAKNRFFLNRCVKISVYICQLNRKDMANNFQVYPLRLTKGAELKQSLLKFAAENQLSAPFILTCCGSVSSATLRYATPKCSGKENVRLISFFL